MLVELLWAILAKGVELKFEYKMMCSQFLEGLKCESKQKTIEE
jgi:hypothetical protein